MRPLSRTRSIRRVGLESFALLNLADVGDDRGDLVVVEPGHSGHRPEVPVVSGDAVSNRGAKRLVGMMVRFVDDRQLRGPQASAPQISAMAGGASLCIQGGPVRGSPVRVPGIAPTRGQHPKTRSYDGSWRRPPRTDARWDSGAPRLMTNSSSLPDAGYERREDERRGSNGLHLPCHLDSTGHDELPLAPGVPVGTRRRSSRYTLQPGVPALPPRSSISRGRHRDPPTELKGGPRAVGPIGTLVAAVR